MLLVVPVLENKRLNVVADQGQKGIDWLLKAEHSTVPTCDTCGLFRPRSDRISSAEGASLQDIKAFPC